MLSCFAPSKTRGGEREYREVSPGGDSANDLAGLTLQSEQQEHITEKIAAIPNLTISSANFSKGKKDMDSKAAVAFDFDPSKRFVRELTKNSEYRRRIAELVKDNSLGEGGSEHILAYINDEGHAVPSIAALRAAMQLAKANDLLLWASRYNLFVLYSADRQHPWDSMPGAEGIAATLEVGKISGTKDEVIVLLDGVRIKRFEFTNSVFKTLEPVSWTTPTGEVASVNLELRMSTFFGYGKKDEQEDDWQEMQGLRYLGTQCHGIMWPSPGEATLPDWPVAPPIIAGKVNTAGRDAALSPGNTDTVTAFEGVFTSHFLPKTPGHPATPGLELSISTINNSTPVVALNGNKLDSWTFGPNNVLAWEDEAGHTAWLQFVRLADGPVFMGNLHKPDETAPERFNVFGELKGQPSRLSPTSVMDAVVGEKVAAGLGVASTLLLAEVLQSAMRIWGSTKKDASDEAAATEHSSLIAQLTKHVSALLHLEDLNDQASRAFLPTATEGGVVIVKDIDPNSAKMAKAANMTAKDKLEVAKQAAKITEKEAHDTEEEYKMGNAAMATYKASQAAWKASQAADAAAEAEQSALEASMHARNARTALALDNSLSASQAYNQARLEAYEAAKAERRAATAALRAVEGGIDFYAKAKNFDKLKEIAEASGVATKALSSATEAVEGWEAGSVASRQRALQAAKAASEHAQECYKHMRRVQPAQQS